MFAAHSQSQLIDQEDICRRLLELQNATGYEIIQRQGQRIYGSPPPGWIGPSPGKGTEIYCYRIPRDCYEDELVPVFSSVGRIYELRLMLEFSGTNRTYCYVRYCLPEDAKEAIKKLNNYRIRPGSALAVTASVDNRKLSTRLGAFLADHTEKDVKEELDNLGVEGVTIVKVEKGDGMTLEFESHRYAALARRKLVPGTIRLWGEVAIRQVEWDTPETDSSITGCNVICVKNVPTSLSYSKIVDVFNRISEGQVETVVRAGPLLLVTLLNDKAAEIVTNRSHGLVIDGKCLEVTLWKPPTKKRLDKGYPMLPQRASLPPNQSKKPGLPTSFELQPSVPSLSTASSPYSPQVELSQLCVSQGWGIPSFHLIGQKLDPITLNEIFQVCVAVPSFETLLPGPWHCSKELAEKGAAIGALTSILSRGREQIASPNFQLNKNTNQYVPPTIGSAPPQKRDLADIWNNAF